MPATFHASGGISNAPYGAAFRQAQAIIGKAGKSALYVAKNKGGMNALKEAKAAFGRFFGGNNPNVVANHYGLLSSTNSPTSCWRRRIKSSA